MNELIKQKINELIKEQEYGSWQHESLLDIKAHIIDKEQQIENIRTLAESMDKAMKGTRVISGK